MTERMHENEIITDEALVRRLLAAQFPQWVELPIRRVSIHGTDNAMYRIGDDLVARLPKIDWAIGSIAKEQRWLPLLAPHLPVAIPDVAGAGAPSPEFPYPWSVYRWLDGVNPVVGQIADPHRLAREIAAFVRAMRDIDLPDAPTSGLALPERNAQVRRDIAALAGEIDVDAVTAIWEGALALAPQGHGVWVHGDVAPGNLLLADAGLHAVIDFSGAGKGDPAIDLQVAWNLLPAEARDTFREAVGADDAEWGRARGRALAQALVQLPYYMHTNIPLATNARHVIGEIVAEWRAASDC